MNQQGEPLPQAKQELMPLVLKIAPGFSKRWEKHLGRWHGESGGIYNDIGEFARYLVDSYDKGDTAWYGAFFQLVEWMIVEGSDEMKELATVGFLEDIQTISSWSPHKGKVFIEWLGPKSREAWDDIDRHWSKHGSLANIIRAETDAKGRLDMRGYGSLLTGGLLFAVVALSCEGPPPPPMPTPMIVPTATPSPASLPTPQTVPNSTWSSWASTWVPIAKDFLTALAIIIGGWWSYNKFIRQREPYPRCNLSHSIKHISLTHNKILLHVTMSITNSGHVLLCPTSAYTMVQQVLPLSGEPSNSIQAGRDPVANDSRYINWPSLGKRDGFPSDLRIEPSESDWLSYDFVIDSTTQVVRIYSYLKNETIRNRNIGWPLETLYDLRASKTLPRKRNTVLVKLLGHKRRNR